MRDIVERLETQAFVADKTQSGMAPLFEECLDEITRLREENETLRRDVKTAVMGDSAELQDVKRENEKLRRAMHDIYEVYAGSEGIPEPVGCAEAYLLKLLMDMVEIAAEHKK